MLVGISHRHSVIAFFVKAKEAGFLEQNRGMGVNKVQLSQVVHYLQVFSFSTFEGSQITQPCSHVLFQIYCFITAYVFSCFYAHHCSTW